jgi:hypothetical protein
MVPGVCAEATSVPRVRWHARGAGWTFEHDGKFQSSKPRVADRRGRGGGCSASSRAIVWRLIWPARVGLSRLFRAAIAIATADGMYDPPIENAPSTTNAPSATATNTRATCQRSSAPTAARTTGTAAIHRIREPSSSRRVVRVFPDVQLPSPANASSMQPLSWTGTTRNPAETTTASSSDASAQRRPVSILRQRLTIKRS